VKALHNTWYVAALAKELGPKAFLSRKLLDISVLMYRKGDGTAVAMQDRCPHRFAPLSLGKRVGDEVQCVYHGLRFDSNGACTHSPHGDGQVPARACVRSFAMVERYGFLWIWMGDASRADATLIPHYPLLDKPLPTAVAHGYMHMPANYQLIVDNVMDLSHVDHVHGPLLNTAGKLSPQKPPVTEDGNTVLVRWEWQQQPPMGLFAPLLPDLSGEAEQFVQVQWTAPSNMFLTVGAVQGSRDYERGLISWDFHLLTPESETSTHYFFGSLRNFMVEDAAFNDAKLENMIYTFKTEDEPLIAAVQAEMGTTDFWSCKPALLSCDPAPVKARRRLQALIDEEQAQQATSAQTLRLTTA
jgi:phenylpropionate dioxygenase-like ring-hydroxylating dioxygenase large terminal subunit